MDNFETIHIDASELQMHHIDEFKQQWRRLDPSGKGRIKRVQLVSLLKSISPPLGLGMWCPQIFVHQCLAKLPVPLLDNDEVPFRATLVGLIRARLGLWLFDFKDAEHMRDLMRYLAPHVPAQNIEEAAPSVERYDLRFFYTVVRLQTIFRQSKDKDYKSVVDAAMPAVGGAAVERVKKIQKRLTIKRESVQRASLKRVKSGKGTQEERARRLYGSSSTTNPAFIDDEADHRDAPGAGVPTGGAGAAAAATLKVKLALADVAAAFDEADVDGSGAVGFEEIEAIERTFGLPLAISAGTYT